MGNVTALFKKQCKDTLKNKNVLIQFVMFPALAILMTNTVKIEGMPKDYFVCLFASMYIGMAPLTAITSILSEEKEKHTLKALLMANVGMPQYLSAIGGHIFLICMVGSLCFGVTASFTGVELLKFVGYMAVGSVLSILVGAIIGIACRNQMSATSLTVPVMMVLSFMPMLSSFNNTIKKAAVFLYSQQVYTRVSNLGQSTGMTKSWVVLLINLCVLIAGFLYVYRRYCVEE